MDVVLDACSIINLINGDTLQKIVGINGFTFSIGDYLYDQEILDIAQKLKLEALVSNQSINILKSTVSVSSFTELKEKYDLGDGETECIAICRNTGFNISSDDKKAREGARNELGESKVIGSLFLLREAVRNNLISCEDAKQSFLIMKNKGGFFPKIDPNYFCV